MKRKREKNEVKESEDKKHKELFAKAIKKPE